MARWRSLAPYLVALLGFALAVSTAGVYVTRRDPLYGDVFLVRQVDGRDVVVGVSLVNQGKLPVRVEAIEKVDRGGVESREVQLEQESLRRRASWRRGPVPFHPVTIAPGQTRRVLLFVRVDCAGARPLVELPVRFSMLSVRRTAAMPLEEQLHLDRRVC